MSLGVNGKNCQEKVEEILVRFDKNLSNEFDLIATIRKCIDAGADINENCEAFNKRPLSVAIAKGSLKAVEFFISSGANPNKTNSDGSTPLTLTIVGKRYEHGKILKYLLQKGVNVCKAGDDGRTPLSLAVEQEKIDLIELLLNNGGKYNLQTAFLDAIKSKNVAIIDCFLKNGAVVDYTYKTSPPNTPLLEAINTRKVEVVEALINSGADVNFSEYHLMASIKVESFNITKLLLENGALVNKADSKGNLPLIEAITTENFELVKYLVEKGADVNLVSDNLQDPLSEAAKKSNIQIFEFLIKSGAKTELVKTRLEEIASENDDFSIYLKSRSLSDVAEEEIEPEANSP